MVTHIKGFKYESLKNILFLYLIDHDVKISKQTLPAV